MSLDIISIAILVAVAGVASVAGYWGRIVKKLEDKRDQIYLTDLPAIYSNLSGYKDALTLFEKGSPIDQLSTSLSETIKNLSETIFSGDILIFEDKLRENLIGFHHDSQYLQTIVKQIQDITDPAERKENAKSLQSALSQAQVFRFGDNLQTEPQKLLVQANKISADVMKRLREYHSYSWKLTIIIFALGGIVALIEIIKGYFSA